MNTNELIDKISDLPSELNKDLIDYLSYLNAHNIIEKISFPQEAKPGFGGGKGIIAYMADDFDEPLEDFKEYM